MLLLLFRLGGDRYGLEARSVVEVVPYAALKALPQAPPYLAGVLNYRGRPVPVVDLALLATDRPSVEHITTRIVVVRLADAELLGLLAEEVNATLRCDDDAFSAPPIATPEAPYLDALALEDGQFVQRVALERLLPAELRARLQDQAHVLSEAS